MGRTRAAAANDEWGAGGGYGVGGGGGGGGGRGGGGYVFWLAADGCDRGVDGANHDDADCDGDAGGDCDAALGTAADACIAVAVADDAHPASRYGDPQTNTSAVRSGYRS